jgi:lipoyl(octanoyl) transferase
MNFHFWKLIVEGPNSGSYNMAVDETLLNVVAGQASLPTTLLRFYQWERPTLSIGFSQKASRVVDFDFCKKNNIDIVRRITGGKAVLHHHEVTYSVTSNDCRLFPAGNVAETYKHIALALSLGFKRMGLETRLASGDSAGLNPFRAKATISCFALSNHYEILCQDRKLVGSAQRRTGGSFLQHGSVLLGFDSVLLNQTLGKGNLSDSHSQVTSLSSCLGRSPGPEEVISNLSQGFQDFFNVGCELISLDQDWLQSALNLTRSKYGRLEWT